MFQLKPEQAHLAAEFKSNPYGHHSPELEAALDRLRITHPGGKLIAICTRPGREWTIAHLEGEPPRAVKHPDLCFESLAGAEWAVFKLRWRHLTGTEPAVE